MQMVKLDREEKYDLQLDDEVAEFLEGAQDRFRDKVENLKEDPFDHPKADTRSYSGGETYGLRVGDMRLRYLINEAEKVVKVEEVLPKSSIS